MKGEQQRRRTMRAPPFFCQSQETEQLLQDWFEAAGNETLKEFLVFTNDSLIK